MDCFLGDGLGSPSLPFHFASFLQSPDDTQCELASDLVRRRADCGSGRNLVAGVLVQAKRLRPPPHWNLKQDSPGTWVLVGISIAVLAALTVLFATYRIGLICAQLLPGNSRLVPATVTGYQKLTGRRRLCNAVATFSVDWGEDVRTCVDPATYGALVSRDLRIGEAVRLEITTNLAGTTLTAVQLSEQVAGTG